MKLAVVGSTTITDTAAIQAAITEAINELADKYPVGTIILTGGAKGVQTTAMEFAEANNFQSIIFEPYHKIDRTAKFSSKYFFTRNVPLIANADVVLAIWDGHDSNTEHAISLARDMNKPLIIDSPDNEEDYAVA